MRSRRREKRKGLRRRRAAREVAPREAEEHEEDGAVERRELSALFVLLPLLLLAVFVFPAVSAAAAAPFVVVGPPRELEVGVEAAPQLRGAPLGGGPGPKVGGGEGEGPRLARSLFPSAAQPASCAATVPSAPTLGRAHGRFAPGRRVEVGEAAGLVPRARRQAWSLSRYSLGRMRRALTTGGAGPGRMSRPHWEGGRLAHAPPH